MTLHVIGFLHHYGLDKDFKLNVEVNHATSRHSFQHDLQAAADAGMLGSIDATGRLSEWMDTDEFPTNINEITELCLLFCRQAGSLQEVINFDAHVRRNS